MNGKEWEKGSKCTYLLPTDPKSTRQRLGVVECFYTVSVSGKEELFVSIKESHVFNYIIGLSIIDTTHPVSPRHVIHMDYLESLVMYATYWNAQAAHLKVALHIAYTR